MKLTDKEQFTIAEALRLARKRYEDDAVICREAATEARANGNQGIGYTRLAEQFDKQAVECTALLNNQFEDVL